MKRLEELKTEMKTIKEKGKFKVFYKTMRTETYNITKIKGNDEEKKQKLIEVCENTIKALQSKE